MARTALDWGTSETGGRVLWIFAGIPVIISVFQAVGALAGIIWARVPVIGALASGIHSIDAFAKARLVFFDQQALLSFLFLLIGISWIVFGATLWPSVSNLGDRADRLRSATAALSGILYFILFIGIYSTLIGEIGTLSLIGFFSIPFIVTAAILGSWLIYPRQGPIQDLEQAAELVSAHLETFESDVEKLVRSRTLNKLRELHPEGDVIVNGYEQQVRDFREDLEALEEEIKQERASPPVTADRAASLKLRASSIDPEAEIDSLRQEILDTVDDRIRQEYDDFSIRSSLGGEYGVVNYQSSIYLPPDLSTIFGGDTSEIHIEEIGPTVQQAIENGDISPDSAVELLAVIEEEFEAIADAIEEKESEFTATNQAIVKKLDELESRLSEDWAPPLANELERIYFPSPARQGSPVEGIENKQSILETISEAEEALHRCLFEEAHATIDQAAQAASDLEILLEDLWLVNGEIEAGDETVDLPSPAEYETQVVSDKVYRQLARPLGQVHNVDVTVDEVGNQLLVNHDGSVGGSQSQHTSGSEALIEDVDYILGVLQERAAVDSEQASEGAVEVNIEKDIPDVFVTEEALACLREYLDDKDEVGRYSVAGNNDYIELEAANGETIDRCVDGLRNEFENWATARYEP